MAESAILVSHTRLQEFIVTALVAMKMSRPIAEVTAGLMVRTDLRGVDSHGIGMLPRYHELWQAGYIRMDAEPSVVRNEVATGLFDGQKGLGHYVSTRAMQACLPPAAPQPPPAAAARPREPARAPPRPRRAPRPAGRHLRARRGEPARARRRHADSDAARSGG